MFLQYFRVDNCLYIAKSHKSFTFCVLLLCFTIALLTILCNEILASLISENGYCSVVLICSHCVMIGHG